MSNFSRTACSLAPAYFHHCRSKSSIAASRSLTPGCPDWPDCSGLLSGVLCAWLATIVDLSSVGPGREGGRCGYGGWPAQHRRGITAVSFDPRWLRCTHGQLLDDRL